MDIQQYISSGAIEAYVLGIASEEEVRELELLSAQHPEVAEAVADCRLTMESYAELHAQEAPVGLKQEIWKQLSPELTALDDTKRTLRTAKDTRWRYTAMAAALGLLFGTTLMLIRERRTNRRTQAEMAQIRSEQHRLQSEIETYRGQLLLLSDPVMKQVPLAGVGTHTDSRALVLWNNESGEVYLSMRAMPQAPIGKQYQLWAIVDGKPVDLGVFPKGSAMIIGKMKRIPRAEMFAITLEQEGGSPVPTLEQMFVAGKV